MNKKILVKAGIIIVIIAAVAVAFRFFTPEDTWLCQNGQWVKHGNPLLEHPTQGCSAEKTTAEQITQILSKKYNQPENGLIIEVTTDTGTFAKGTYNQPNAGGGLWFAVKTAEGWQLVFDGNGIIPCDAANKYDFPDDIISQCLDTANQNQLIERAHANIVLPHGYTLSSYTEEKVLDTACVTDSDCHTPAEYQMISRCPMTTLCLSKQCTVVCPNHTDN